jgi:uncharacterized membrane protein YhaH (DUF805 family)
MEAALALVFLMAVHVGAGGLRFLDVVPRSAWLSAAGGISVAYVMVHLLPELGAGQKAVNEGLPALDFLEDHVYLMALVGLALFYWVELASRPAARGKASSRFWFSVGSFAVYNAVIGYLVIHRQDESQMGLALFSIALGLHFVVNDHALRERHERDYDTVGRWALVAAIAVGWVLGELTEISESALGLLIAFVGGGVILNVMKEELPEDRQSRFWAFALGAAAYATLLQLI